MVMNFRLVDAIFILEGYGNSMGFTLRGLSIASIVLYVLFISCKLCSAFTMYEQRVTILSELLKKEEREVKTHEHFHL